MTEPQESDWAAWDPEYEDTRRRCLKHNEWHRRNRDLVDQWDADLFGDLFATE